MDAVWIQVFVLTFSECVAPAGKTVCQPQQFELEFLTRRDCEYALQQIVAAKDALDNVIIDQRRSGCTVSARQVEGYPDLDAVRQDSGEGWREPEDSDAPGAAAANSAHRQRLQSLEPCAENGGRVPCRVGEIIVEDDDAGNVEVWRRGDD